MATASASSANGGTVTTGPNTSSVYAGSSGRTGASTVGGYQNPGPDGAWPRNATGASDGTYEATCERCAAEISGPISVFSEAGSPTATPRTAVSNKAMNSSSTERWTRMRERAQQSCPALSNTAYGAVAAAFSRSASAKTTLADLPPSSSVTRLIVPAAACITPRPTSVEPVKPILATSGCSANRCPT